jgi:hypothetical protein
MESQTRQSQRVKTLLTLFTLILMSLSLVPTVLANHTVLVEGEADFDGDGIIGVDEDGDGDQVFGTINAAVGTIGAVPGNVADNGRVVIVTSGRFFEGVRLVANGVSVLEAAPGVTAVIEAFQAGGDPDANTLRQTSPGIVVTSDGSFPVELRNLVIRNWTVGILATQGSRVTISGCKIDSNVNYGIRAVDHTRVAVVKTEVNSSGFRRSGTEGIVDADPCIGISFEDGSRGIVTHTTIAHSFAAGLARQTSRTVRREDNTIFNNHPNTTGF